MVAYMDNDKGFSFLIGGGSQPYMTINVNMVGDIMVYWGSEASRVTWIVDDIDELRQIILDRFDAGDTLKENELFYVELDISAPKNVISALKNMLLGIGVSQCKLVGLRDIVNQPKVPLPPPQAVTQAEVINIAKDGTEIEKATIVSADGQVEFVEISDDVLTKIEEAETEEIFRVVEQQPEFPGGMAKLIEYLQTNIHYPKEAQDKGIQGRVIVQFVVNKDGSICDECVVKPVNSQLDAEAIRVIRSMPNWKPGTQKGKAVRVRFTLPVTFRLTKAK